MSLINPSLSRQSWILILVLSLLLAIVLVELQNTCKKKLNKKTLEQPNICYIFDKLRVQGCQIGHSHVSIPFNSAPAHSTRPHNAKKLFKSSFQAKFQKIRFTKVTGKSFFFFTHMSQKWPETHCGKFQNHLSRIQNQVSRSGGLVWVLGMSGRLKCQKQ